jgi:hypothetical protein
MDKGFSHLVEIKDLKLKLLNQVCGMLSSSLVVVVFLVGEFDR